MISFYFVGTAIFQRNGCNVVLQPREVGRSVIKALRSREFEADPHVVERVPFVFYFSLSLSIPHHQLGSIGIKAT